MKTIDLRSDTVTQPTAAMREAMAAAELGDDVYGEDPTINRLEALAAEMLGTESAIFASSGTQSNLLALLVHCRRGDEYIVGQRAHTYKYEGGGAAVFGSIQPQPLDFADDGTLPLDRVEQVIKPEDVHFARTRLFCLENTNSGLALPLHYLEEAEQLARSQNLAFHLDGARIFNASVKLGVPVDRISRHFDSISVCLSKGLGAPVGSILCANAEHIKEARKWRKMLGGGMRQAGMLAAAGIFALENHVERLAEDHAKAELLAEVLAEIPELQVSYRETQTNMVFVSLSAAESEDLQEFLRERGIMIMISKLRDLRLVTHLDITEDDVKAVGDAFKDFFTTD